MYRVKPRSTVHEIKRDFRQHGKQQHTQRVLFKIVGVEIPLHRHKGKDGERHAPHTGQPVLRGKDRCPHMIHQHKEHGKDMQRRGAEVKVLRGRIVCVLHRHTMAPLSVILRQNAAYGVLVPKRTVFVPLQSFSFPKAKKANRRNHRCRCQHTPRVDSCRNKNGSRTICAADYTDCLHPRCIEGSCRSNRNSRPHPCPFHTVSPCCVLGNHCTVSAGSCQAYCQPRAWGSSISAAE